MKKLEKPYYFTPNVDQAILSLFPFCSTDKLSVLLDISTHKIVNRYRYLTQKRGAK